MCLNAWRVRCALAGGRKNGRAMPASLALIAVAIVFWLPEHAAPLLGWTLGAADTVAVGVQGMLLWGAIALWCAFGTQKHVARSALPALSYAVVESAMRAGCRLALPMDRPYTGKEPTCEAAFGTSMTWVSVVTALVMVALVAHAAQNTGRHHGPA